MHVLTFVKKMCLKNFNCISYSFDTNLSFQITLFFPQKFAPLDELQNVSLIIFHSNFTSQTTMELINILRGRLPSTSTSGNGFEEIVDVTHSKKPPISALLWNRNDFKVV